LQRCNPDQSACAVDTTQDTSRFNLADTTRFALPDCPFGIRRIAVVHAAFHAAFADVECAARPQPPPAADGGLPVTGIGGGTR
jgi:hypothetical protein